MAVWSELIVPAVAVKLAEVAPDATVTDGGTLSVPTLLDSGTTAPPAPAALDRPTVHVDVPPEVRLLGTQLSAFTTVAATSEMLEVCEVLL